VRSVAAGSLTMRSNVETSSYSGARGAPDAAASASTMRWIASSTRRRTGGVKDRTLTSSSADPGMMLACVPARRAPTVTTADSRAPTSRDTTPWSRMTVAAAMTTGSTVDSGLEPWPPLPCRVTRNESVAAIAGPAVRLTTPTGRGMTCCPRTTSGRPPVRSNRPSATIARAPPPTSSAGWKTTTSVPDHVSRCAASSAAAPSRHVTCTSWPHACMVPDSWPSGVVAVSVEA